MKKLLLIPFLFLSTPTLAETSFEFKCYTNDELKAILEKVPAITLYSAHGKDGKKEDFLLDVEKKAIYTVKYEEPKDGNALDAKQYCVTDINVGVSVNENAIEFFSKFLERMKGQKT